MNFDHDGVREIDSLTVYHYFLPKEGIYYNISTDHIRTCTLIFSHTCNNKLRYVHTGEIDPFVDEVGVVTDIQEPELRDFFYYTNSYTEANVWQPSKIH